MADSTEPTRTVFIVDDDEDVRDSLRMLLRSVGLETRTFPSADAFLAVYDPDAPGCLVLDVRMPGMSGLGLQETLAARGVLLPIIFITGHGDVPAAVRAMRQGAIDFLQKPFDDQALLDRIHQALETDRALRAEAEANDTVHRRIETLTVREREVMDLVVAGLANKNIASQLDVSPRTVEIHRARVMTKMKASSLAHLVKMVLSTRERVP